MKWITKWVVMLGIAMPIIFCHHPQKADERVSEQIIHFEHEFIAYSHKDSIPLVDYIESYDGRVSRLEKTKAFLYKTEKEQIRAALKVKDNWATWQIDDAANEQYYASIDTINFDAKGLPELAIQSFYGMALQSTMGESYYGGFQLWNIDSIALYFEMENYFYEDDMGRNGENTYQKECVLAVEVQKKSWKVRPFNSNDTLLTNIFYHLPLTEVADTSCVTFSNEIGSYFLENGVVRK